MISNGNSFRKNIMKLATEKNPYTHSRTKISSLNLMRNIVKSHSIFSASRRYETFRLGSGENNSSNRMRSAFDLMSPSVLKSSNTREDL